MRVNILSRTIVFPALFCLINLVNAVSLDIDDNDSICNAAAAVANGEWNYYEGLRYGGTVGMFQAPYYWWNAGEAFGGLLTYYTYCASDNDTLKEIIYDGMYHQAGSDYDYIPSNQSLTEGNDDQGVWAMTVMGAAEMNFTDPPHSWLSMTQAIYNTMVVRWDSSSCDGGLRWQIFSWNNGYDYKNSIANGCLFHIAARLARYTGDENGTYSATANKVWDWMEEIGFLIEQDDQYVLYDGADIEDNCTDITKTKWSYTYGIFLSGAAYMYNHTSNDTWLSRAQLLLTGCEYFLNNTIFTETSCSSGDRCNTDQRSFRSLFSRTLGLTSQMAPETYDTIRPWIEASAKGAAQSCSGGTDGVTCGFNWNYNGWDGLYGLGEQMSALETILALQVDDFTIYSSTNGGTSKSDPSAGVDTTTTSNVNKITVTTKDKAGAGILTVVVLGAVIGGAVWMIL